jgi:hypothetical protein
LIDPCHEFDGADFAALGVAASRCGQQRCRTGDDGNELASVHAG